MVFQHKGWLKHQVNHFLLLCWVVPATGASLTSSSWPLRCGGGGCLAPQPSSCGSLSSRVALLPMEPGLMLSVLPSAPSANTCDISVSFTSAVNQHLGYSGSVVTRTRDLRGLRALLASKSPAAGSPCCVASACGHLLLRQHLLELHGVGGSRML